MNTMRAAIPTLLVLASLRATSLVAADGPATLNEVAEEKTVRWQVAVVPAEARPGDAVEIVFTANIAPGWILYSSDFKLDLGPLPTRFAFDANPSLELVGAVQPVEPRRKTDRSLGGKYSYFSQHAEFRQKARLVGPIGDISGRVSGQTCFEDSGLCKLFRETFSARR